MGSRRGFLAGAATAVAGGLAGCLVGAHGRRADLDALAGQSGSTAPDRSGGTTTRTYGWTHDGAGYELDVAVPDWLLAYARARPRVRDRGTYVADPYHDGLLDAVAARIAAQTPTEDDALGVARTFVQGLPYETDAASVGQQSYPRYPAETLAAGRADCEDAAVVLAGLLERLGHESVLLAFWEANHMALGLATDGPVEGRTYLHDGDRYAYVETAVPGWDVGEVPDLVGKEVPEVMTVDGHAALVTDWATERAAGGLRARTTVRNVGDATASDVRVRLALETADGETVGAGRSDATAVPAGGDAALSATVGSPGTGAVRADVEVFEGETLVDAVAVRQSGDAPTTGGDVQARLSR